MGSSELIFRGHESQSQSDGAYSPKPAPSPRRLGATHLLPSPRARASSSPLIGMTIASLFFTALPAGPAASTSSAAGSRRGDAPRRADPLAVFPTQNPASASTWRQKCRWALKRKGSAWWSAGGAGFVGSHLVDRLIARGDSVMRRRQLLHGEEGERGPSLRKPNFELIRHGRRRAAACSSLGGAFAKAAGRHPSPFLSAQQRLLFTAHRHDHRLPLLHRSPRRPGRLHLIGSRQPPRGRTSPRRSPGRVPHPKPSFRLHVAEKCRWALKRKGSAWWSAGGAGFVGSHLVDRLIARGDSVMRRRQLLHGEEGERGPSLRKPNFELIRRHGRRRAAAARGRQIYHLACPRFAPCITSSIPSRPSYPFSMIFLPPEISPHFFG
ncbi:uncharacterized protein A4U43_C07F9530 [Asparagus officinalis]|uniref:NAD-dependent epimerase/dehydratase domain-containing protein n=1 Tax=Asparagus officinalis TaxID=4686 RepID=A0A5P1EAS7_ASPOF|nr:uncharacterized protein A4U43_C07F9530 [Asparagus officinalis]